MKKWVIKLRIFFWVILILIVIWVLYMGIVPSGRISYFYDFTKDNYFIKKLAPGDRVLPISNGSQSIIEDPAYFAVRTSRPFDKAIVTIKYKNKTGLPLVEMGVLADKVAWNYALRPVENQIIDKLSLVWDVIEKDGVKLFERNTSANAKEIRKFSSIDEILNDIPDKKEFALYNYDLEKDFILEDYVVGEKENRIDNDIRGTFRFYTYIKNEDLDFIFAFKDLNKNKESEDINIKVFYKDLLIDDVHVDGDGINEDNGKISDLGEAKLKLTNLPEGLYKIEVRANDDIVTDSIKTRQSKLSFINRLWIYENVPLNIYTETPEVKAQTINPASLQVVKIGDKSLDLKNTYEQFSAYVGAGRHLVEFKKGDVIVAGNGVFSFSEEALINPEFRKVDANIDINKEEINYVLARYASPGKEGDWNVAQAEFNLKEAHREFSKYNFLISVPGLKNNSSIDSEELPNNYLEIKEIKVDFWGTTLLDKIKRIFKR